MVRKVGPTVLVGYDIGINKTKTNCAKLPKYRVRAQIYLTRFNKIAIQGTLQMAVDKEAISLSRVYSYDSRCTCRYSMCNPP